jgi:membrane-associated protease RseP (regulator of RpoE activity)
MNVMFYDISFLIIFVVLIGIFLYRKRKNLKKEGLLLLYRTSWGIKLIDRVGKKFRKTLNFLSYLVVGLGYLLMGAMVYLFGKIVWIYVINPEIVKAIKIPPIMPLIPYLPQIFNLDFLPPFYFTYWIIIIAIVAIVHEFAHGIFAANRDVRIKKTGFGFFPFFLPVFLAAFVELDEKEMKKKKIFPQMSVLAAGTFVNVLTAIFFFGIMFLFFSLAFAPAGVTFDSYTYSVVGISAISTINGVSLADVTYEGISNSINEEGLNEIMVGDEKFLLTKSFLEEQQNGREYVLLYDNAPAVNANLEGIITQINDVGVNSRETVGEELSKYSPGDEVVITTIIEGEAEEYTIALGLRPDDESAAYLGVGFVNQESSGLMGGLITVLSLKEPNIYYEAKFNAGTFIYDLLWWLVIINISIALVNMLPVGIFDGGRFFYLTILAITKKEKVAKKAFSIITYLFLLLLLVIMAFWLMSWFK